MPRIGRNVIIAAVLACVTLAGSTAASAAVTAPRAHALLKVRDPGKVTGTIHGHCTYRDKGQLPDPRCTPGSIDPIVTQANIGSTICKKGWTATVRPPESQTEAFKYDVAYPAYGTPQSEKTELDHLVPLELGGSNDATNLWPEYPPTPNPKEQGRKRAERRRLRRPGEARRSAGRDSRGLDDRREETRPQQQHNRRRQHRSGGMVHRNRLPRKRRVQRRLRREHHVQPTRPGRHRH